METSERYTYRVIWSEEDHEYVGLCTELPSLSWLDKDQTEALTGINRLAQEVCLDLIENGEPLPEPLSLKKFSGKFQVRIPPDDHRRLAMEAKESGVSLNRLIASKLA